MTAQSIIYSTFGEQIVKDKTSGSRLADGRLRINLHDKCILDSVILKSDIVKILLVENITIKLIDEYEFDYDEDPKSRPQMIKYLLELHFEKDNAAFEAYTDTDLIFVCKWYLTQAPNYLTVNILENYYRANNRFLHIPRKNDPRFS